jgi:tetratricopeptide (TPR) repeat protein
MTHRLQALWLLLPAAALVAAGPTSVPPDELVRRANEALGRKQFVEAMQLYGRAEERSTDPGLVAFDEGVALYQKGNYAEAEVRFRLARQDATDERQLFATYNLAASILQEPGDADPAKLAEAVRLLEDCLGDDRITDRLAADARHNLELAKMLWAQAKARTPPPEHKPPDESDDNPKPPPQQPRPAPQPGPGDTSANPSRGAGAERSQATAEPGQEPTNADGQKAPGEGNLPVIPDRDELAPMSREEAEAHLHQAIDKVLREGRAYRQRTQKAPPAKVRDW